MERGHKIIYVAIFLLCILINWFISDRKKSRYIKEQTSIAVEKFCCDLEEVGFSQGQIDTIFHVANNHNLKIEYNGDGEYDASIAESNAEHWNNQAN